MKVIDMAKAKKKPVLSAMPLGGVGEIGMNMMAYECDQEMIIVDTGIMFPDEKAPGTDVVLPDTRYLQEHVNKLVGVFITHAHEDHIGAIGYVWEELNGKPVYVTPFSKLVLDNKLKQLGIKPAKGQVVVVNEGERHKAGAFDVEYIHITHSIPEAYALAIRTPHGTIMHTGDYKFDDNPALGPKTNEKRLKEIGDEGVLVMLGDSTNAFKKTPAGSEAEVVERVMELIDGCDGRIVLSSFASNTYRVLKICEEAAKKGRKIAVLGRTVQNMVAYAKELGFFPAGLANSMIEANEVKGLPDNKVLIFASGTQGEAQASLTRLANGDNVRGIALKKDDTVILSSKMIPGNERGILDVFNKLLMRGCKVINEAMDDIHVSGHGGQPEIKRMYDLVRPQIVVPVHGEYAHLQEQERFAKECGIKQTFLITNGRKVVFGPGDPYVVESGFRTGRNYVDGYNILEDDQFILRDRLKLAYNGVVVVSIGIDRETSQVVGGPQIQSMGLIDESIQGDMLTAAEQKARQMIDTTFPDSKVDDVLRLQEVVSATVRKLISSERGKKPPVLVTVLPV